MVHRLCVLGMSAALGGVACGQNAEQVVLEFFDTVDGGFVSDVFGGAFVNGNGASGVIGRTFGPFGGTPESFVWVGDEPVFFSAGPGSILGLDRAFVPDLMGHSTDNGFVYATRFMDGEAVVITDAGAILREGDPLPGLENVFSAGPIFGARMADDGTIFVIAGLGEDPGVQTDRALLRISDYRASPTAEIVFAGGTTRGTPLPGGLAIGSNAIIGAEDGGITDDYAISQNGRYVAAHVDVVGPGITSASDDTIVLFDLEQGTAEIVLREGQPTGDGDNWDNLVVPTQSVRVNNRGDVVVIGDTDGPEDSDALLALDGEIIAREGDDVTTALSDGVATTVLAEPVSAAINNNGRHISLWETDVFESDTGSQTVIEGGPSGDFAAVFTAASADKPIGGVFTFFDTVDGAEATASVEDFLPRQIALGDDRTGFVHVSFNTGFEFNGGVIAIDAGFREAGCNPADLAEPFFVLDGADVNAFISAFGSGGDGADIAAPFGTVDGADVNAFITFFGGGCGVARP